MKKEQYKIKKELAKSIFMQGVYTQDEISNLVGISRVSIGKWIKDGKWEEMRTASTITPQKIIYQLTQQIDDINKNILSRPEGKRFATTKEADAILKLSNTIKNLQNETGLKELVSVSMAFLSWLRDIGEYEKGKEFVEYFNLFITDFANKKNGRKNTPQ
jgi:DNA-binding XRE family transcriptional regulator